MIKNYPKIRENRIKLDNERDEQNVGRATLSLQKRSSTFIVRGSRSTTGILSAMESSRNSSNNMIGSSRKKPVSVRRGVEQSNKSSSVLDQLCLSPDDVGRTM